MVLFVRVQGPAMYNSGVPVLPVCGDGFNEPWSVQVPLMRIKYKALNWVLINLMFFLDTCFYSFP